MPIKPSTRDRRGIQRQHVVLTPLASHDEAIALSFESADAPSAQVQHSALWLPVRLPGNLRLGP